MVEDYIGKTTGQMQEQMVSDRARCKKLKQDLRDLLRQPGKLGGMKKTIKDKILEIEQVLEYIKHHRYQGYIYTHHTPEQIGEQTVTEIKTIFPWLERLYPTERQWNTATGRVCKCDDYCNCDGGCNDKGGDDQAEKQRRGPRPGYMYETTKYHKTPKGKRPVASQAGSCT